MQRKTRFKIALVLAVPLCLALAWVGHAAWTDPVTRLEVAKYVRNAWCGVSLPRWQIFEEFGCRSVQWQDWPSNTRFAVYDPLNDSDLTNDLVLDKSTGLVWTRDTSLDGSTKTWHEARHFCMSLAVGNVRGFRLPKIEEMYTLFKSGNFVGGTASLWVDVPTTVGWWTATLYPGGRPYDPYFPDPPTLPIMVVDEDEVKFVGSWTYAGISADPNKACYDGDYAQVESSVDGSSTATFVNMSRPPLGSFKVYVWWTVPSITPASNAPYTVSWDGSYTETFYINQNTPSNMWYELPLVNHVVNDDSEPLIVQLTNQADGYVVADAVKVVFDDYRWPAMAMYKAPAPASDGASAQTLAPKNVWAVRGGCAPASMPSDPVP